MCKNGHPSPVNQQLDKHLSAFRDATGWKIKTDRVWYLVIGKWDTFLSNIPAGFQRHTVPGSKNDPATHRQIPAFIENVAEVSHFTNIHPMLTLTLPSCHWRIESYNNLCAMLLCCILSDNIFPWKRGRKRGFLSQTSKTDMPSLIASPTLTLTVM